MTVEIQGSGERGGVNNICLADFLHNLNSSFYNITAKGFWKSFETLWHRTFAIVGENFVSLFLF